MAERLTEIRRYNWQPGQPWIVNVLADNSIIGGYVLPGGTVGEVKDGGKYENKDDAEKAEALYLIKCHEKDLDVETSAEETKAMDEECINCVFFDKTRVGINKCASSGHYTTGGKVKVNLCDSFQSKVPAKEIRTFDTGATRDTVEGKLSYVKALSPVVLQRYVQYLDAHRKQPDGSMRDFDNWKQGIPEETYLDGLGRHFVASWLLAQGYPAEDNHGAVTLEDSLCAIIFGASGWLHEILKGE